MIFEKLLSNPLSGMNSVTVAYKEVRRLSANDSPQWVMFNSTDDIKSKQPCVSCLTPKPSVCQSIWSDYQVAAGILK